jgi:hypothetical protein
MIRKIAWANINTIFAKVSDQGLTITSVTKGVMLQFIVICILFRRTCH